MIDFTAIDEAVDKARKHWMIQETGGVGGIHTVQAVIGGGALVGDLIAAIRDLRAELVQSDS